VRSATSKRTWSFPAAVLPCATVSLPSAAACAATSFACRPRSAPTHSGYSWPRRTLPNTRYLSTPSKNSRRASTVMWRSAPSAMARASSAAVSTSPPVSTVTVMTGRPSVSFSQATQNDVSRPPENASSTGLPPVGEVAFIR
jgi:hypothetical protein